MVEPRIATTPMVFSSHRAAASGPVRCSRPGSIGTIRGSTCQYRQNFSQQTCTLAPMTRLGRPPGVPAAAWRARHRHSRAIPPSMQASLDPVVEQPVAPAEMSACHRSARMATQRRSISAVCGYSSLSIMFLLKHSAISCSAWGSIQVVTNVARFSRALPSRISSSRTTCSAVLGSISVGRDAVTRHRMAPGPDIQRVDVEVLRPGRLFVLRVQGHLRALPSLACRCYRGCSAGRRR